MEKKEYLVKDTFDIANYMGVVKLIAEGFFSGGDYTPHFGKINAMRLFYNICVVESPLDFETEIITDTDMNVILEDERFMPVFAKALHTNNDFELTFGNAYKDAIDIVNVKKGSLGQLTDSILEFLSDSLNSLGKALSPENIGRWESIAKEFKGNDMKIDNIIKLIGEQIK